jgi:hypothetical protein
MIFKALAYAAADGAGEVKKSTVDKTKEFFCGLFKKK